MAATLLVRSGRSHARFEFRVEFFVACPPSLDDGFVAARALGYAGHKRVESGARERALGAGVGLGGGGGVGVLALKLGSGFILLRIRGNSKRVQLGQRKASKTRGLVLILAARVWRNSNFKSRWGLDLFVALVGEHQVLFSGGTIGFFSWNFGSHGRVFPRTNVDSLLVFI